MTEKLEMPEDLRDVYVRLLSERASENGQLAVDLIERIARLEQDLSAAKAENLNLRLLADHADIYWDDEEEHWSPEEYAESGALNIADEFELTAAAYWKTKHRVTKVPNEINDDYDTEEISGPRGGDFPEYFRLKATVARLTAQVDALKAPFTYSECEQSHVIADFVFKDGIDELVDCVDNANRYLSRRLKINAELAALPAAAQGGKNGRE